MAVELLYSISLSPHAPLYSAPRQTFGLDFGMHMVWFEDRLDEVELLEAIEGGKITGKHKRLTMTKLDRTKSGRKIYLNSNRPENFPKCLSLEKYFEDLKDLNEVGGLQRPVSRTLLQNSSALLLT